MQKDKSVKVKSPTHSRSVPKRSLEGMIGSAQRALFSTQPPAKPTFPLKNKDSSKCIAHLSTAIEILQGFETLAEGTKIPGIECPFRILIKTLTIIKNMKENNEDSQYLFALCEKHLRVALDTVWQNEDPLSTFSYILKYFIDTLLEVNDSMPKIQNRNPIAAMRLVLSDKQKIRNFTQRLNDGMLLFVNSSLSESEARRAKFEEQIKQEMAVALNRLETRMDEIMSRLDRIFLCQQPLEQAQVSSLSPITHIIDHSIATQGPHCGR